MALFLRSLPATKISSFLRGPVAVPAPAPPPAPAPTQIAAPPPRLGRIPPGQQLYGRLYAMHDLGDGTVSLQVVGYVVPGGTFFVGEPVLEDVRTDQPGSFGLQFVEMFPITDGAASGWMPAGTFELLLRARQS